MGFIDHENHTAVAFVLLGGEQGGGLVYRLRLVETGGSPERGGDGHVHAPATTGRVGQIHEGELGPVERGHRGSHGHGLARSGVAHDHAEGGLVDAVVDPGDGLGVGGPVEEFGGGGGLGARGGGEPEV